MNLAHPVALCWLVLSIPIVLLYWRRAKIRRTMTATGMFWDEVLQRRSLLDRLRQYREPVSLAMQLVLLLLMTLALAEPRLSRPRSVLLIVDNSGENATVARKTAEKFVRGLHEDDQVVVLSAAPVTAHCGPTGDRAVAAQAAASIPNGKGDVQLADALTVGHVAMVCDRAVVVSPTSADTSAAQKATADGVQWVHAGTVDVQAEAAALFGAPQRAVWFFLAGVTIVVLALEWWLYHRRLLT